MLNRFVSIICLAMVGTSLGCATIPRNQSAVHALRERQSVKYTDARETMYGTDKNGYSDHRRRVATGVRR